MFKGNLQAVIGFAIPLSSQLREFCNLFPCALCGCERACDV